MISDRISQVLAKLRQAFHVDPEVHWYSQANLPWRRALFLTGLCFLATVLLWLGKPGQTLQSELAHRVEFWARGAMGREPRLHPRLKIFALDHKAVTDLDAEAVSARHWTTLLKGINERKPAYIFIDKVFGLPLAGSEVDRDRLKSVLKSGPPVIVGAFLSPQIIDGRLPLPLDREEFDLARLLGGGSNEARSAPSWLRVKSGVAYGPHPTLMGIFPRVGHTNFVDEVHIEPLIRVDDEKVLPHWSLLADPALSINDGVLSLSSGPVPTDYRGRVVANLASPKVFLEKTYSLRGLFRRAKEGQAIELIQPGDVVVILTRMHQGETDIKYTPAGVMPGGFVLLAMLNSTMTGQWLRPVRWPTTFIAIACLVGMSLGIWLNPISIIVCLILVTVGVTAVGACSFTFYGVMLPWLFAGFGLVLTGGALLAEKTRVADLKSRQLRHSLEGLVDSQKLDQLLKSPDSLQLAPSSQVLTIMFIDIVGFSVSAERKTPALVFQYLKELMAFLTETVHRHGGIVDKTLGDGLLCFFGYHYGISPAIANHADIAVRCALQIQRETMNRNLKNRDSGKPVYPLRIGINTAEVYVGDLGGPGRLEFTIIGHGVNYAHRLENACDSYQIICGASTYDMLSPLELPREAVRKRLIPNKHNDELIEGYELDPFHANPNLLHQGTEAFREFLGIERKEPRWPVAPAGVVRVILERGQGELVNFSHYGMAISVREFYGRGATLTLALDTEDGKLGEMCRSKGLYSLLCEVRWGRPHEGKHLHGLYVQNLTSQQRMDLVSCLREAMRGSAGSVPLQVASG